MARVSNLGHNEPSPMATFPDISSQMPRWLAMVAAASAACSSSFGCPPQDGGVTIIAHIPVDSGLESGASCEQICRAAGVVDLLSCDAGTSIRGSEPVEIANCTVPGSCVGGRRPAGFRPNVSQPGTVSALALYFSQLTALESASITAFHIVAETLKNWEAPRRLGVAARRAARDEARHTALAMALAKSFGGHPAAHRQRLLPPSGGSLDEFAIENATEGCVRETFGALAAAWQAARARDTHVRRTMTQIARDEATHADLAWSINKWVCSRLSRRAIAVVREARRTAVNELAAELHAGVPDELIREAGVFSRHQAITAMDILSHNLWDLAA